MLELTALPARQGDALWIRWGDAERPHQLIIDMGTEATGKKIRKRLEELPEEQRHFELLVVTHVDSDHIGGVLTCVSDAEDLPGLKFDDVWFNGFEHLSGQVIEPQPGVEHLGAAQGERLTKWLRKQSWNRAFGHGPVWRREGEDLQSVVLADGLELIVLGPTPERLEDFIGKWAAEVHEAIDTGKLDEEDVSPGLEQLGRVQKKPVLVEADDLKYLAEEIESYDDSKANGSSISLLLKYKGISILLTGDAYAEDVRDGIRRVSGNEPLPIDLFKVSHHGSRQNLDKALIDAVECNYWLISTDGTTHKHPDPDAIARIISWSTVREPRLGFNVPCEFNRWWDNAEWIERHAYSVEFGTEEDGITIEFPLDT